MQWSQFHGNSSNQGFQDATADFPLYRHWAVPLASPVFAAPVIDSSGAIFVGTNSGRLWAIEPNGLLRWRRRFEDSFIASAAAIGPDDDIYIVTTKIVGKDEYQSTLHRLNRDSSSQWSVSLPGNGWTTAAPTLWSSDREIFIFLYATTSNAIGQEQETLLIYNGGGALEHNEPIICQAGDLTGGFDWGGFFSDLWDLITVEFDGSSPVIPSDSLVPQPTHPTVAVIPAEDLNQRGAPYVVVAGRYCTVQGFRWDPPGLTPLWRHDKFSGAARFTSPAAGVGGMVVVGRSDGHVYCYLVETGQQLWIYDAGESVFATPAVFGGPFYVISRTHARSLSLNGALFKSHKLVGTATSSPVLTKNKLYMCTSAGIEVLRDNFSAGYFDSSANGGLSSPAIDEDGILYAVVFDNGEWVLAAYGDEPLPPPGPVFTDQ